MTAAVKMEPWQWKWAPHFTPEEFADPYGEPDSGLCMQPALMDKLFALRGKLGVPIVVHRNGGFASRGHEEGSAHYRGLAADFHVPGMKLAELSWAVRDAGFNGVGFYEHWAPVPGFHVDMAVRRARWACTKDGIYVSLS